MSFQFALSSADLSDDELSDSQNSHQISTGDITGAATPAVNPLDAPHLRSNELKQPQWEGLNKILESLKDVRVSFEKIHTPDKGIPLYRRELFDVKHQLMTESDEKDDEQSKVELEILMGETNEDVRKNVYEGGLKSWECSIDLVDALSTDFGNGFSSGTILELGCGTSLPSEYLFAQLLKSNRRCDAKLILADYNDSVLRLVSIPNLIITWALLTLDEQKLTTLQQGGNETVPIVEYELIFTSELLTAFEEDIVKRGISILLASGTWGRDLCSLLSPELSRSEEVLLLSSETIYHPETLPIISELILELMQLTAHASNSTIKTLVAAKDIYFGVGGSVIEFERYMQQRIKERRLGLKLFTQKVQAGLKRSIVSIE
ncbi:Mitotic exit network interactor 1 [Lachancea thermotolerans]|uniref:protein-histidine N-methyltransferase n=1 Tax=Lachancea thermotolerans (strain ATCC 56472 / CBS 6340 / NRRL Y-8284) TaxID=559295 RepID=C5DMK9_LACTC|nr:KLTH0G09768p [Lachancea thermotolerans CBS 6340]CAR25020.1 KLTH0G09768p [Lachancea thermotolerans CBS 6340]